MSMTAPWSRSPSSSKPARKPRRPRNDAERHAARWYRLRGYRILDTNRRIAGYELDVVARRGSTVVVCEVKSKSGTRFGDPLEMVTPEKVRRVRRAAEAWLAVHSECATLAVRFDVIVERAGRLEHIANAF
jgi:putative endonuclease